MLKPYLFFVFILLVIKSSFAQDFPYGKITQEELSMKTYAKDTSAHAVVLQEFGKSRINVGSDDNSNTILVFNISSGEYIGEIKSYGNIFNIVTN